MVPALETSRLILRPLELADATQAQMLFPEWEVVRYLTKAVPWPYPPDGCYTFYRDVTLPAVERGDEWAWTLRLKTNPQQMIGAISLLKSENHNRGFWLALPWQRIDASQDWHPPHHCSFLGQRDNLYPPHCVAGTWGAEFPSI